MVFTLHQYVFRELIRIFVLATLALTLILSLGNILQPIQKYGVGPQQVPHLLAIFVPITLTFVLPMGALFAATLTYGRLAGDNELAACKASGISPLAVIYPGCLLAILVATANLLLSFHVMPRFVHEAEYAIKADAKQILFRNIQRRGYYRDPDGDFAIYADQVPPKSDLLSGVVVLEMTEGVTDTLIAAELARLSFTAHEHTNEVQIAAAEVTEMKDNSALVLEKTSFKAQFGSILADQVEFKRLDEIKAIRNDLMNFFPVERQARKTCDRYAAELLARDIQVALDEKRFVELTGDPNGIRFRADQCRIAGSGEIQLIGNVDVTELDGKTGGPRHRLVWEKAFLYLEGDKLDPTLTIDLHNANAANTPNIIGRTIVTGLSLPETIRALLHSGNLLAALQPEAVEARLGGAVTDSLKQASGFLRDLMNQTLVQIDAVIHFRLVFGIGCVPMILIGIGLGILQRGSHMLTAFASSCLPAVILIVCIVSGRHVAENPDTTSAAGFSIMWTGLVALWIMALFLLRRVYRS